MNISCVICSDLFSPSSEVHVTQCGHMFHFPCLMKWLDRSESCPQCRNRVTEKKIYRVYFNIANISHENFDIGTLLNKITDMQLLSSETEKERKMLKEKLHKFKNQQIALRTEIANLEDSQRAHESAIHALKEQIAYFKSKAKDSDRLNAEIVKLKNNIKDMENVQVAINGTRDQANELIRNQNDIDSLAIVAAMLKKNLLEAQQMKREAESNLKRAQYETKKYKKEYLDINSENSNLKRELQHIKSKYEREKQLKHSENSTDTTISSVLSEHGSINRTSLENSISKNTSLPITEKVQNIIDSNSPYLPVKAKAIGMEYRTILNAKYTTAFKPSTSGGEGNSGYSIFRSSMSKLENRIPKLDDKYPERGYVSYNGLGGSSKEDIFPSPKPLQTGLKRNKTRSTTSSKKFKKLGPGAFNAKVTDHFESSSQ